MIYCNCGNEATEYDDRSMACYCHECAVERAEALFEALSDDDKLDLMGFEVIE